MRDAREREQLKNYTSTSRCLVNAGVLTYVPILIDQHIVAVVRNLLPRNL